MSVFKWIKGKLRLEGGNNTANVANVTAAFELNTLDPQVLAAINTLAGVVATQVTLAALKARADLLGTEATLATRGTEATLATRATEATALNIKNRADLLGTEATLTAFKNAAATELTLAVVKARADLLGTEATLAALKARADVLASEATLAALKTRADLLGTEATLQSILSALNTGAGGGATETTQLNVYARLLALLGDAIASPAANTIGDRLKSILTAMTNNTQLVKTGIVRIASLPLLGDTTNENHRLDGRGRIRTVFPWQLGPTETMVERYGAISLNSATDTILSNATGVPAGYPAQNINYTVPANRIAYPFRVQIAMDPPGVNDTVTMSVEVGGVEVKKHRWVLASTNQSSNGWIESFFPEGYSLPAGAIVRFYVRTGGLTVTWVRLDIREEATN